MHLLDHFEPAAREHFLAASTLLSLPEGAFLVRRGELGGDLYMVASGTLEVLEQRDHGEAIFAVLEAGSVVGELSFLDDSPRSADVRAREPSRVHRWTREDLRALLDADVNLASKFYAALSRALTTRLRNLSATSTPPDPIASNIDDSHLMDTVYELVNRVKTMLDSAHRTLVRQPGDVQAHRLTDAAFQTLQDKLLTWTENQPSNDALMAAITLLQRELRPWFAGSPLAIQMLAPDDHTLTTDLLEHVLTARVTGDGPLSLRLEQWLHQSPHLQARRAAEDGLHDIWPDTPPSTVLLLDTPAPTRLQRILAHMQGGKLILTDPSRAVLSHVLTEVSPGEHTLEALQINLAHHAIAWQPPELPASDLIILGELLAYLPDRTAVPVLEAAAEALTPDGHLLLCVPAPEPAGDHALFELLLHWPLVRRSKIRIHRLLKRAGLCVELPLRLSSGGLAIRTCRA